jgi:hypothetical protein
LRGREPTRWSNMSAAIAWQRELERRHYATAGTT